MGKATNQSSDDFTKTKERIRQWLLEDEWKVRDFSASGLAWGVVAEDGQKKVALGQVDQRSDFVFIEASVDIPESLRQKVREIRPLEEREQRAHHVEPTTAVSFPPDLPTNQPPLLPQQSHTAGGGVDG